MPPAIWAQDTTGIKVRIKFFNYNLSSWSIITHLK
jgi:hypothetical protein